MTRLTGWIPLAALAVAGWVAIVAPTPPAVVPANAPAGEFSAERAFVHVRAIAQFPRPNGSTADDAARAYILGQLETLGLKGETQTVTNTRGRALMLHNVMARIPGTASGTAGAKAIALVCHHDSVWDGPGASDDGSGVATVLETARAIKAMPPVKNDVVLLFTDAEEIGMVGAQAFVDGHPWAGQIGLVLNFEARGVSGPVLMFETSEQNGFLVRQFARSVPRPVANSIMYEVYRRMPNNGDMTIFKEAGLQGFNFAFIGSPQHYHKPTDDPTHMDLRSLQHHGSYALSLVRQFGDLDLSAMREPDAVYFDLFSRVLVHYPYTWAVPLAILNAVLWLGLTLGCRKRGKVSFKKLPVGAFAPLLTMVVVVAVLWFGFPSVARPFGARPDSRNLFLAWPYWLGAVGLTITLHGLVLGWCCRRVGPENLMLGALCLWSVLAEITAWWMPGASYLMLWPAVFCLLGVAATLMIPAFRTDSWRKEMVLGIASVPAVILLMPLVYSCYVGLGAPSTAVPMALLVLLLGAISGPLDAAVKAWRWTPASLGVLLVLISVSCARMAS